MNTHTHEHIHTHIHAPTPTPHTHTCTPPPTHTHTYTGALQQVYYLPTATGGPVINLVNTPASTDPNYRLLAVNYLQVGRAKISHSVSLAHFALIPASEGAEIAQRLSKD